jgi:hypothetical protein
VKLALASKWMDREYWGVVAAVTTANTFDNEYAVPKHKKLIPKNERHHWWPKTLSRHWADSAGLAHSLSCDGELVTSKPEQFGAIRNDNNIYLSDVASPWDESFEHTFGPPDALITPLIDWLKTAESPIVPSDSTLSKRLTPLIVDEERFTSLTKVLASLIARSPSFRHRVKSGTRALRERIGLDPNNGDRGLLGMNVRNAQATLSEAMTRGKFAVLLSGSREFIFGDGFFHNVHSVANSPRGVRCIVPLTPAIAIFYTHPMRYHSYPRAFVLNLTNDEIDFVNRSVQIYSKRFVFYRSQPPNIEETFTRCTHLQWQYDKVDWTDALETAVADTFFGNDSMFYPPAE